MALGNRRATVTDPRAALEAALARVAESEERIHAWVRIDAEDARAQAARVAADAPLRGAIIGVKDLFDVAGWPTRCGLPQMAPAAERDADAVALLRRAGGVVLGKTQTTPYAWLDPAITRNPHDRSRTPGGSSAGSAAAVSAGHCTVALGTQTAGSTLRPAAFCGIVGYKPTFGRISTVGVTPLAPSLDHVGIFARDVAEVVAAARTLGGHIQPASDVTPLRFICDVLAGDDVIEEASRAALARAAEVLRAHGYGVRDRSLPAAVRRGGELIDTIVAFESARIHGEHWDALHRAGALPPHLRRLLERGTSMAREEYEGALVEREALRAEVAAVFDDGEVLLTPSAPGEAPSLETTGDARYVRPWTCYGCPAISIPCGTGPNGLPIGVQLVAAPGCDGLLLSAAARLAAALA